MDSNNEYESRKTTHRWCSCNPVQCCQFQINFKQKKNSLHCLYALYLLYSPGMPIAHVNVCLRHRTHWIDILISFYEIEKETMMMTTALPMVNPFIDIVCCSSILWFFLFFFLLLWCSDRYSIVADGFTFCSVALTTIVCMKRFSKQIEHKLKNSLCTFSIFFYSHFDSFPCFHKTVEIKWLSCRIRETCSVATVLCMKEEKSTINI